MDCNQDAVKLSRKQQYDVSVLDRFESCSLRDTLQNKFPAESKLTEDPSKFRVQLKPNRDQGKGNEGWIWSSEQ